MNLKTTLALVVLAGCAVGLFFTQVRLPEGFGPWREQPVAAEDHGSRQALDSITPASLKRIEIHRGKEVTTLDRASGGWVMPGNWPTRPSQVRQLVELLTGLRSRFDPLPLSDDADRAKYGMDRPSVTVTLHTTDGKHVLAFAEKDVDGDSTRFDRPTFVRIDERDEVLRLGPGLLSRLDRPSDFYLQRRLFPFVRVAREEGSTGRVERLDGNRLVVDEVGKRRFALVKTADGWQLSEPYRDALDPASRDRLLEAVADLWAERFLDARQAKDLEALGLKQADSLTVTRHDGRSITLWIGRPTLEAGARARNYARLSGFDRVFEVNADRLKDILVPLDTLRDSQLARFGSSDARELEITTSKGTVVLRKSSEPVSASPDEKGPPKAGWQIVKPISADADSSVVDRLLSALTSATALDRDVRLKAQLAGVVGTVTPLAPAPLARLGPAFLVRPDREYGLSPPAATIVATVLSSKRPGQEKTKKTFTVRLGRHDRAAKKIYATSQDWPRINEIDDALADLVLGNSALDYRGKRVLDFTAAEADRLEVRRLDLGELGAGVIALMSTPPSLARLGPATALLADHNGGLALQRGGSDWKLTAPVSGDADADKVNDLLGRLSGLEVLAWVSDAGGPDEMQSKYALGVPGLSVTVSFKARKPITLHVGKQRAGAPGYYARLEGRPEVFVIADDVRGLLNRDSLAYRRATLWQVAAGDEVVSLRIAKAGQPEYDLRRKGEDWEVTGPFAVKAPREVADKLVFALLAPRAEEYRAHATTSFAPFGLGSPEVKVNVTTKQGKQHTLWVGKEKTPGSLGRLACLGKPGGAVFVVSDRLAQTVDQSALDFLDRQLFKFDASAVASFARHRGSDVLELAKKDDTWRIVKPADLPADEKKVPELMKLLSELKAERVAAYQSKELKTFGLDRPEATVTIKFGGEKPRQDVLLVGAAVKDKPGERYAQVKGSPLVAELSRDAVEKLLAGPLAYRDHLLARLPDADTIKLEMGERKITFGKPEGTWKVTQPLSADADHDALEALFNSLARLRADELVTEKPSAEQLKTFGLDKPVARWQFLSGDAVKLDLLVGQTAKGAPRRYARIEGNDLVFLLDPKLSEQLVAEYRPRTVFKDNIDPAQIEAVKFGYRKDAFELKKVDGAWQVVGKPDVKLDDKAVSDCLSALRDLKRERYVKDAGAQLKLYGLSPPELALEVMTPSGKHTLYLGGQEGTTKKRYARVPVAGRDDVFLLDVTASTKLFKDLAALTKP